jgi:C1A family cysteine protease
METVIKTKALKMETVTSQQPNGLTRNINVSILLILKKSFQMKQFSLVAALCFAANALIAQIQLPTKFVAREAAASANLKQELVLQRKLITDQKLSFMVGNTSVSGKSIASITGESSVAPDAEKIQVKNQKTKDAVKALPLPEGVGEEQSSCATLPKYDARSQNIITPVRSQMCGNCWTFGAVGAYEANYLKVNGGAPNALNLSEQHAQTCSGGGSCGGGFAYKVFQWMADQGKDIKTEAQLPQTGNDGPCGGNVDNQYVR